MRIKKSLTNVYDYVSSFLEALCYKSIDLSSSLSDSKYIENNYWGELWILKM